MPRGGFDRGLGGSAEVNAGEQYAALAQAAMELARAWAQAAEYVEPDPTDYPNRYSSYHYSERSSDSADAAAASSTAAQTSLEEFLSIWCGAHATPPSFDGNGNNLTSGDLYFNTTDETFYVFDGATWVAQAGSGGGVNQEDVEDIVGAMAVAGAGINVTYDDTNGTLTIANTQDEMTTEEVQDIVGTMATAGTGISVAYDDGAGTLTVTNTAPFDLTDQKEAAALELAHTLYTCVAGNWDATTPAIIQYPASWLTAAGVSQSIGASTNPFNQTTIFNSVQKTIQRCAAVPGSAGWNRAPVVTNFGPYLSSGSALTGGFVFECLFGLHIFTSSGSAHAIGVTDDSSLLSGTSNLGGTATGYIYIGRVSGDTNWKLIHKANGTAFGSPTTVDTGYAVTAGELLRVHMSAAPGSTTVRVVLQSIANDGTITTRYDGTVNASNYFGSTGRIGFSCQLRSSSGATTDHAIALVRCVAGFPSVPAAITAM